MPALLRPAQPGTRDERDERDEEGVPCAARPGTSFRHLDGPCQCFFGGPPPEFAPSAGSPR